MSENFTLGHVFVIGLNLIGSLASFSALGAVAAIVWAGFLLVTSAGNEEKAKTGKTVITYAILGLLVILFARVIVAQALRVMSANCPYQNIQEIVSISDQRVRQATASAALANADCVAKYGGQLNNLAK